ncbi:MAG: YciI family protein [Flammeovirgaceae bacterium]
MKDFMLVFRNSLKSQESFATQSPEQMQAEMALWQTWMGKIAEKNQLGDGQPLFPEGKVLRGPKKVLTDGPFIEGKDVVGGYMIIKAKDYAEAVEISKGCPQLNGDDGTAEVREIMKMGEQ